MRRPPMRRCRSTTPSLTRGGPSSSWGPPASADTSSARGYWTTPLSSRLRFLVSFSKLGHLTSATDNANISCIDTSRPKESGEIDGSDYHFISRQNFEAEAGGGKFLEHGEYDKQYYGTGLDRWVGPRMGAGKRETLHVHILKFLLPFNFSPTILFSLFIRNINFYPSF